MLAPVSIDWQARWTCGIMEMNATHGTLLFCAILWGSFLLLTKFHGNQGWLFANISLEFWLVLLEIINWNILYTAELIEISSIYQSAQREYSNVHYLFITTMKIVRCMYVCFMSIFSSRGRPLSEKGGDYWILAKKIRIFNQLVFEKCFLVWNLFSFFLGSMFPWFTKRTSNATEAMIGKSVSKADTYILSCQY